MLIKIEKIQIYKKNRASLYCKFLKKVISMFDRYLTEFKNSYKSEKSNLDLSKYNYVPTVKYRKEISDICKDLFKINQIYLICPAIILENGTSFYTSNDPFLAIPYIVSGLYRADNYFINAYNIKESHFFPGKNLNNNDILQMTVAEILQNYFKVYNSYCLIRRCKDCTVIVGIAHNYSVDNPEKMYVNTVSEIENLTIKYFDKLINIYVDNLPGLKHSRFVTDSNFREKIIKNRTHKKFINRTLTNREEECLYWTSIGKTSHEVSVIMHISEHTVNEYKKFIMEKLNVKNMVHAVSESIKLNIIC